MVQVVKFPAGSRCVRNLTPDLENQSNPDLEVSRDADLFQSANLRWQNFGLVLFAKGRSSTTRHNSEILCCYGRSILPNYVTSSREKINT